MHVKPIELIKCDQIDVLLDELFGHEVPSHVEVRAAPLETRLVLDLDSRHRPDHADCGRGAKDVGRQKLPQRLDSIEHAGGPGRADRDLPRRHREPIALIAQPREGGIESQGNRTRRVSGCTNER